MISRQFLVIPFLAATLSGCASGSSGGGGGGGTIIGAGTFTLAPGESRTLRVSTVYRVIRICNDVGSSGTIEGAVGDYPAVTLAPGVCNANSGQYSDRITVHNVSSSPATGLFQSAGTKPLGKGGR
jgi:hypothetical protein